jgi:hypothetical protein
MTMRAQMMAVAVRLPPTPHPCCEMSVVDAEQQETDEFDHQRAADLTVALRRRWHGVSEALLHPLARRQSWLSMLFGHLSLHGRLDEAERVLVMLLMLLMMLMMLLLMQMPDGAGGGTQPLGLVDDGGHERVLALALLLELYQHRLLEEEQPGSAVQWDGKSAMKMRQEVDVEVLSVRVHRGEWVGAWVCSGCA